MTDNRRTLQAAGVLTMGEVKKQKALIHNDRQKDPMGAARRDAAIVLGTILTITFCA